MKAAILTFTYGDNYGQRLQNLAMQEYLQAYFEEVYTIRQIPVKHRFLFRTKRIIKKMLNGQYGCTLKRHQNFEDFDKRYIHYYGVPISEDTAKDFPEAQFDYYVAGSDQIWSPYSEDVNSTMFLKFAPSYKRIALSPSIAAEEVPDGKIEQYKDYFLGFHYLSSREYAGSELISNLSGKEVDTLIDPTLMFDATFWDKYERKPSMELPTNYALVYMLGSNHEKDRIDSICKEQRLELLDLMNDRRLLTLGPDSFIYLIHNAKIVFTDSYHGTIFSILHRVPFAISNRSGISFNMNSRFQTLYSKLGIQGRCLDRLDTSSLFELDFESIYGKLFHERNKFIRYFEKCIAEE